MEILTLKRKDYKDVMRLEAAYLDCPWSKKNILAAIDDEMYVMLKAVENGKLIGYAGVAWCLDEGNICNIVVDEAYRRRGVALALVNALIVRAREQNIVNLFLEVNENNTAAQALYEKAGFRAIMKRPHYYGSDAAFVYKFSINGGEE